MKYLFNIKKFKILFATVLAVFTFCVPTFCIWGRTEKGGIFWVEPDGTIAINGWKLIDDNYDGVGYYYYFNENGFILLDDITPDYKIVNKEGKRVDYNGVPVAENISEIAKNFEEDMGDIISEEIMAYINAENGSTQQQAGVVSSGTHIYVTDKSESDGPKPSDFLFLDPNADGTPKTILGPNVKLVKEKEAHYDPQLSKKMNEYIKSGDKYSKSVNGTTFNKTKWKEVMALKGTGATIVFENPKNNFNKLKGRIATHYFTYTDRTTTCTLTIYNEDDGEELYSTSAFNYNAGVEFDCTFPKKASAIRFELEVTGQYTSRVCYLRNCEYGFDKELYEQELYEDEIEAEYRKRVGNDLEEEYNDEESEYNPQGEMALEGEDPVSRYRRINGLVEDYSDMDYDENDDTVTPEMRASISELRRLKAEREAKESERRDNISGPAYDPDLINRTAAVGPNGEVNIIAAKEGE